MNWYKKAILVNKNYLDEGRPINVTCSYCGRWATHPFQENPSVQYGYIWKTTAEMDNFELNEMRKILKRENNVSHGICDYCYPILRKIDVVSKEDLEKVKSLSLEMV